MSRCRSIVATVVVVAGLLVPASAGADSTRTVRYGPFTVPGGTHAMPGSYESLRVGVPKPCSECYITSIAPDLTYANDGTRATMATGMMLHHAVFASQWRSDATCSGTWLGLAGERFFASGDERSRVVLPAGYGYRLRWYDRWNLLVDLMNMGAGSKQVYLTVTYTYRSTFDSVRPVKPIWLDIDNCGDSEYSIPATYPAEHDSHWDWQSTMDGTIVAMGGHVHHTGRRVEATNESQGGSLICSSSATEDMEHVVAMSPCTGFLPSTIRRGDNIRLHSIYSSDVPRDDVMGIMLGYVDRTG
jgi:hypothetical protein